MGVSINTSQFKFAATLCVETGCTTCVWIFLSPNHPFNLSDRVTSWVAPVSGAI